MTQPQLARLVRLWRNRLGLIDWQITAELATVDQLPDCYGTIPYDAGEGTALLRVRDCESLEAVVVHELLHLRLAPFGDGDESEPGHEERERAINLLAGAFLAAYPRRRKKGGK